MIFYKIDGMYVFFFFIVNLGDIYIGVIEVFLWKELFENGIVWLLWFCYKIIVNEMISWYWFNKLCLFSW